MSNIFVTSDLHLGHKNIITYCRKQFETLEEHNETIIDNWNNMVGPKDTVLVLGDVVFGQHNDFYMERLKGYKRLIGGNHDQGILKRHAKYFDTIHGVYERSRCVLTHIPVHPSQFYRYRANIHGHLHDKQIYTTDSYRVFPDPRYVNVCLEHWDMKPVPFDTILELLKDRGK